MVPELFAVAGALVLIASLVANFRPPVILGLPSTITGFFMAELARVHIVLQVLASAIWIAFGALDEPVGFAGLGGVLVAVGLLERADRKGRAADTVMRAALPDVAADPVEIGVLGVARPTFPDIEIRRNLDYGPEKRNKADVYLPSGCEGAPIVLQVHGGGWVSGDKRQQGQPLLSHFTRAGWIGVAINYRLAPRHRLPACVHDTKRAIAWVKANAHEWGGDPDRILLTGGSAGGHLTALGALTGDDTSLQPGFEDADCTVAAAAPMYGVFDLTDRHGHRGRQRMTPFLDRMVMSTKLADDAEGWDALSPITRVRADAPPMLVVSCVLDTLAFIADAREFGRALTAVSPAATFVELPHAHHAFDVINGPRTQAVMHHLERWASEVMAKGEISA